jgi:hypothetical protein
MGWEDDYEWYLPGETKENPEEFQSRFEPDVS